LAEENGGYLPASSDLRILDGGLRQTMQKHRELFAHIKQKQKDGPARGICLVKIAISRREANRKNSLK